MVEFSFNFNRFIGSKLEKFNENMNKVTGSVYPFRRDRGSLNSN